MNDWPVVATLMLLLAVSSTCCCARGVVRSVKELSTL